MNQPRCLDKIIVALLNQLRVEGRFRETHDWGQGSLGEVDGLDEVDIFLEYGSTGQSPCRLGRNIAPKKWKELRVNVLVCEQEPSSFLKREVRDDMLLQLGNAEDSRQCRPCNRGNVRR